MASLTRSMRVRPETHKRLQKLARETNRSLPDVLDEAISQYERNTFFEGLNEDFRKLREDSHAWREEQSERKDWEITLGDDLHDEPPYPPEAMLAEAELGPLG